MSTTNTKVITATIDAETYTKLIQTFEINNQDDMDSCIDTFIQNRLKESSLTDTLNEYYSSPKTTYTQEEVDILLKPLEFAFDRNIGIGDEGRYTINIIKWAWDDAMKTRGIL